MVFAWATTERRQAAVHLANSCARNLFSQESPQVFMDFADLMVQTSTTLSLPRKTVEALIIDAYGKAIDLGGSVDLHRTAFTLQASSEPGERSEFIRMSSTLLGG